MGWALAEKTEDRFPDHLIRYLLPIGIIRSVFDLLFEQLKGGLHGDSDEKDSSHPQNEQPVSTRKYADRPAGGIPLAPVEKKH